ncbi:retropepsin-like aspartic protease [Chlorogloeopsis sp. ULAP01]|uniref:retropepsin-like aspartic protease family protein n=1 Tax=Chlorogloeopsis sp. ULAP01 TaxID=3056483 RepID=UPI0025AABDC7|nr:retropepsin-like aspartic protease [Chlorogloeopsis sp. ULAP01]MDM9379385.1 retropepsin-like aspartic protease [Chlorogloeopsis sp. ULAP01]
MLQSSLSQAALIFLSTTMVVFAVACREDKQTVVTAYKQESKPTASSRFEPDTTKLAPTASPEQVKTSDELAASIFGLGLDKAASAHTISQSAQSTEDWNLVASQYQDAIALMKQVERHSAYFEIAQTKILEYQRLSRSAQQQASPIVLPAPKVKPQKLIVATPKTSFTPKPPQLPPPVKAEQQTQPSPTALDTINNQQQIFVTPNTKRSEPVVFVAPIKRRVGGTPIIEVTFNGEQQFEMIVDTGASGTVITQPMAAALGVVPVGKAKANTASAKAVEFPVGYVNSIEAGGITVTKVGVAIAGSELETGLLGHDFFGDYEITIKRDVVEFRPPSHSQQLNSPETGLTVPTSPKPRRFEEYP